MDNDYTHLHVPGPASEIDRLTNPLSGDDLGVDEASGDNSLLRAVDNN